jgi:hypothetical protein
MRRLTKRNFNENGAQIGTSDFITRLLACCHHEPRKRLKELRVLKSELSKTAQDRFYPLVADLFQQLGCEAHCGRTGDTSNRVDVEIKWKGKLIPAEVKSPQETHYHDVKSIRQALENKVVCLARYSKITLKNHTSLSVAFDYPNERSDVHELVCDIYKTFGIRVGMVDIHDLMESVIYQKEGAFEWSKMSTLLGRYDEATD